MKRWRLLPKGVKASLAFFLASVVTSGIAYITTPIYTRLLTADEFGVVSVYLTLLQVVGTVAMFCLHYGVFNNGMMDYEEDKEVFSFSLLILSNIITVICGVLYFIFFPLITSAFPVDIPLSVLLFIVFLTQPAYNFWLTRQRFEYKYKKTVVVTVFVAFFSPTIAIAMILLFPDDRLYARLFGAELAFVAIYAMFYVYLAVKARGKIKTSYWRYALGFNAPLIPHYLATYLLANVNKVLIVNIVGEAEAGYYSVAFSVSIVVTIIWSAANASLVPYTYEKCREGDYEAISNTVKPILVTFAGVCLLIIMLAPEIVMIMATPEYYEAIYVIPALVGGVFFQVNYYLYANILYYHKQPKWVMVGSVAATVANIALGVLAISQFGYLSAGYVTLICYIIQAVIDYAGMHHVLGFDAYNMRFIGVLSSGVLFIAVFGGALYPYMHIRLAIVLILAVLAIVFRKRLASALGLARLLGQ